MNSVAKAVVSGSSMPSMMDPGRRRLPSSRLGLQCGFLGSCGCCTAAGRVIQAGLEVRQQRQVVRVQLHLRAQDKLAERHAHCLPIFLTRSRLPKATDWYLWAQPACARGHVETSMSPRSKAKTGHILCI